MRIGPILIIFATWIVDFGIAQRLSTGPPGSTGRHRVTAVSPVPVLDWNQDIALPDDVLFARHATESLIFLVTLDAEGRVAEIKPISGFSLYLSSAIEQIKLAARLPSLASKTVVFRVVDPLNRYTSDAKSFRGGVCTSSTDLLRLYQLGAYIRAPEMGDAALCYKLILERNPNSLAGRWGAAQLCWAAKATKCHYTLMQSVVASNPEFIEARIGLAHSLQSQYGDDAYESSVDEILKLDITLAQRAELLDLKIFSLEEQNRIDDALPVLRQWKSVITDLLHIYPPKFRYGIPVFQAGLLEEAKGLTQNAIDSYRLALAHAGVDSLVPESRRFDIDLALARTLRKTGNTSEPRALCDRWATRKRHLVNRPPRAPWEGWEDGSGEVEGRWEFSCGNASKGLQLIEASIQKHPESYVAYLALSEYYYSVGEIEKARAASATFSRLMQEWGNRLGQFGNGAK